jgi:hypothetical protein
MSPTGAVDFCQLRRALDRSRRIGKRGRVPATEYGIAAVIAYFGR